MLRFDEKITAILEAFKKSHTQSLVDIAKAYIEASKAKNKNLTYELAWELGEIHAAKTTTTSARKTYLEYVNQLEDAPY